MTLSLAGLFYISHSAVLLKNLFGGVGSAFNVSIWVEDTIDDFPYLFHIFPCLLLILISFLTSLKIG